MELPVKVLKNNGLMFIIALFMVSLLAPFGYLVWNEMSLMPKIIIGLLVGSGVFILIYEGVENAPYFSAG